MNSATGQSFNTREARLPGSENAPLILLPAGHCRRLQTCCANLVERGGARRIFACGNAARSRGPFAAREDEASRDRCYGQEANTEGANTNLQILYLTELATVGWSGLRLYMHAVCPFRILL